MGSLILERGTVLFSTPARAPSLAPRAAPGASLWPPLLSTRPAPNNHILRCEPHAQRAAAPYTELGAESPQPAALPLHLYKRHREQREQENKLPCTPRSCSWRRPRAARAPLHALRAPPPQTPCAPPPAPWRAAAGTACSRGGGGGGGQAGRGRHTVAGFLVGVYSLFLSMVHAQTEAGGRRQGRDSGRRAPAARRWPPTRRP